MKAFKLKPDMTAEEHEITRENVEKYLYNRKPYYTVDNHGRPKIHAVCPACSNPIKIVALTKAAKVRAHGKHAGYSVKDLATWNIHRYKGCAYANAKRARDAAANDDDDEYTITDEYAVQAYELLRDEFDTILTLPMAKARGFSVQRPLPSTSYDSRWSYIVSTSV